MNCCIKDLGAYPHNKDLNTGIDATQTGQHKAILFFAGVRIERKFSGINGQKLVIPMPFNESYIYKLQILQPDGVTVKVDDCEDFKFKIYLNIDLTCPDDDCEEENILYL